MIRIKKFVTLIEVIVGSVIVATIFGGLFSSFLAAREYIHHSNKRLMVVYIARSILDDLNGKVRQDTWDDVTGPLYAASDVTWDKYSLPTYNIDSIVYGGVAPNDNFYQVKKVAGRDYRQVEITLNYPTNL